MHVAWEMGKSSLSHRSVDITYENALRPQDSLILQWQSAFPLGKEPGNEELLYKRDLDGRNIVSGGAGS